MAHFLIEHHTVPPLLTSRDTATGGRSRMVDTKPPLHESFTRQADGPSFARGKPYFSCSSQFHAQSYSVVLAAADKKRERFL